MITLPEGLEAEFKRIDEAPITKLSDNDKAILRARIIYLDDFQKEKYADILKPVAPKEEPKVAKDLPFDGVAMTEASKKVTKNNVSKSSL